MTTPTKRSDRTREQIIETSHSMIPSRVFLTRGVGRHKEKLASFEMALRQAQLAQFNLIRVSSILPPGCRLIDRKVGLNLLHPGQFVYCVMSQNSSNEPHRLLAASIGLAMPSDRSRHGYLSEHHSFGEREETAGDYAEDLAAQMLATIVGVEFDPDSSWDEKKNIWRLSEQIVKTRNITQSATVGKARLWTTVVAGAVFIL